MNADITVRGKNGTSSVGIARRVEVEAAARIAFFYHTTTPAERLALYWYRVASAPHAYTQETRRPARRLHGITLERFMRKKTGMTDTQWQTALYSAGRALAQI